jgi:glycosyltransferase involved in cell wall biosynthesis
MTKISAVIICFNNQDTIVNCVQSLAFADEVLVLDSFSNDKTLDLLKDLKCTVKQQAFKGYAKQKQDAIDLAENDWIILLDSDEYLSESAQNTIQKVLKMQPNADAYQLPRREWVFWQWSHPWVKKNTYLRLFNRHYAKVTDDLVHESIQSTGRVKPLNAVIQHYGESSISKKIEKINVYSQLSAEQKYKAGKRVNPLRLVFYPLFYFFKQYFLRRQIFNGWAGLINASLNSRYAYLKYAKLYELQKNQN